MSFILRLHVSKYPESTLTAFRINNLGDLCLQPKLNSNRIIKKLESDKTHNSPRVELQVWLDPGAHLPGVVIIYERVWHFNAFTSA